MISRFSFATFRFGSGVFKGMLWITIKFCIAPLLICVGNIANYKTAEFHS